MVSYGCFFLQIPKPNPAAARPRIPIHTIGAASPVCGDELFLPDCNEMFVLFGVTDISLVEASVSVCPPVDGCSVVASVDAAVLSVAVVAVSSVAVSVVVTSEYTTA